MEENKLTAEEIVAQRRIALYNIKAKNSGFGDFFGKDKEKEKKLEVERQKLIVSLKHNNIKKVDEKLERVGIKHEDRIKNNINKQRYETNGN